MRQKFAAGISPFKNHILIADLNESNVHFKRLKLLGLWRKVYQTFITLFLVFNCKAVHENNSVKSK